jgi:hypothetical protein
MSKTICLGGCDYPIAPLTLKAMRTVAPAFTRISISTPEGMAAQVTVIAAAMQAANPSLKFEDVEALAGVTFDELKAAVEAIGEMMGLRRKDASSPGDAKMGEAVAPAPDTGPAPASPA